MTRLLPYLFGPELYWTLVCVLVKYATRRHLAPNPEITSWLDDHWAWLPFIFTPLAFASFLVPDSGRWWLLLRIDISTAIGLFVAAWIFCEGMTYHKPDSGPGAGSALIAIPILGCFVAFIGTAIAAGILWWRSRGAA